MPVNLKRYWGVVAFIGCLLWSSISFGQGQGLSPNNWYFGNSTEGIIFRKSDNEPVVTNDQAIPYSTTASAVATDPVTGDLIFYTNGQNVYDRNHQPMPLGTGLLGNPNANQGVVVAPVPQDDSLFYVFTNDASFTAGGTVRYSVVDRFASGNATFPSPPLGNLTVRNQALPITNASEAMLVVAKANLSGYWLITQENGTAAYNVLDINQTGFGGVTTYDFSGISPSLVAANFSYNDSTSRIAVAPQDTSKNVQVLTIDRATGDLNFVTQVFNSAVYDFNGQALYDTEWSASGDFLYISRHGANGSNVGNVLQWNFNNQNVTLASVLPSPVFRSYGLQKGPDNRIYHLYQENQNNPIYVGRIATPDSLAADMIYELEALGNDDFVASQFPATLPPKLSIADTMVITYVDSCLDQSTKFFANVIPRPDNYFWDFGDGSSSNEIAPVYAYQNPGGYTVTLTTTLNGQVSTTSTFVSIVQSQLQVDLGQDTVICPGETLQLDAGPGGSSYAWSTGETTQQITIDSAGYYWVVVVDPATGCEIYDAIQVDVYGEIQQTANVWYFGNEAGIDFNEQPPVALTDGAMNTLEGCATASDSNGDLLFYTNGETVWNREHNIMANGTGLNGDSLSAQSSMIVPFPDDETLFYIFHTQRVYGDYTYQMNYSVVDMKEDQGRGEVAVKNKPLFINSTERLTGSMGPGPSWVIGHEYGNNTFRAYPITDTGIGNPVLSSEGSIHSFADPVNGQGYMKLSPNAEKLAVALAGTNNVVELFDFDSVGNITNVLELDIPEGAPSQVYGVEFSQDSRRLYASVRGSPSKIYTWEIDTTTQINTETDPSFITASRAEIASENEEFGALQLTPNGQIFVAVRGSGFLASINNPGAPPASAGFQLNGFDLDGKSSWLGLPNFIQNQMSQQQNPGASSTAPACVDSPINFAATPTSIIDEFFWNIENQGNFSTQNVDSIIYNMAGVYNAAVQITNRCVDSLGNALLDTTINLTVNVFDNPPEPIFADPLVICGDDLLIEALPADTTGIFYNWNTGDTTRAITVTNQGFYSVTLSNVAGCTSEKETLAADAFTLDLGPDRTICQNSTFPVLDTQVPGSTYVWTVNGNPAGNTQSVVVDTSVPGVYEYIVQVTEGITLCTKTDTATYTITPEPAVTLVTRDSPGCGVNQGEIDIDIQTPSIFTYVVNGPSQDAGFDIPGPTVPPITADSLLAGTYTVQVSDLVDGCSFVSTVNINDAAALTIDSAVPQTGCGDLPVDVQVSNVLDLTTLTYNLINLGDSSVTSGAPGTDVFTTAAVPPGSYSLEVLADGCLQSTSPLNIVENPRADGSVIVDNCVDPNQAIAVTTLSNPAFSWVFNSSQVGTSDTLDVSQSGSYMLTISDLDGVLCDTVITTDITVEPVSIITLTPDGDECDGQLTLNSSITPSGNFIYQWLRNTVAVPGANAPSITVTDDGDYELRTINQSTNCTITSSPITVNVREPVEVDVISDAFCDTGDPFEVIADVTTNATSYTVTWYRDDTVIPGQSLDTLSAVEEGTFRAEVETNENCFATDEVNILLAPSNEGQLPNRAIICPDDADPEVNSILLDPGPNFVDFTWFNSAGQVISSNSTYLATSQDTYSVDLLNGFGCPAIDSTEVIEDCIPKIYGPNAFRPEGTNTEFFLFTEYVDEFQIFIFDRWGALLFQSDSKDFAWDGTFEGELLPTGTYAYVVKYTSEYNPGVQLEYHGGVLLLR